MYCGANLGQKTLFSEKNGEIICVCQKKAVPLHPLSFQKKGIGSVVYNGVATVAQLVEQRIRNAWVGGSSPPSGSK